MFKKSLLALAVAGFSVSATAGTIYSSATAATATGVLSGGSAGDALGANGAVGLDDNCDVAADDLGVTLTNTGNGEGGDDDVITFVATTNFAPTTAAMTGAGTCTVTVTQQASSATAKSPAEAPAGTVTVGAVIDPGLGGFREEDTLTINFNGAGIDLANTAAPALAATGAGSFSLLDITANRVRFTVDTGNDIAANEKVTLSGIVLDNSTISSSTAVSIDYFATNTSGTQYDVTAASEIHEFVPQYSAEITVPFNGVIDVQANRQSLVAAAAGDTIADALDDDSLRVTLSLDADTNLITPAQTQVTINGDFAWFAGEADADEDGEVSAAEALAYVTGGAGTLVTSGDDALTGVSLSEEMDALTLTISAGSGVVDTTHTFTLTVPGEADGNPILNEQDFTASVVVQDGTAAPNTINMTAATEAAAGSWTLNGSVIEVPYLPFGPVTQPIFRHTNTGNQSGDISLRYMVEGEHSTWQEGGVLIADAGPGVRNLLSEINAAMVAEGYDASADGFKVAIEITTNVPDGDVALTVGAKFSNQVDTDRLSIGVLR